MPKLKGYMYEVVETFPIEDGQGFRTLKVYDRLEDAEAIWTALESRNYDFSSHAIVLIPLWEPEPPKEFQEFMDFLNQIEILDRTLEGWDANGSPTREKP